MHRIGHTAVYSIITSRLKTKIPQSDIPETALTRLCTYSRSRNQFDKKLSNSFKRCKLDYRKPAKQVDVGLELSFLNYSAFSRASCERLLRFARKHSLLAYKCINLQAILALLLSLWLFITTLLRLQSVSECVSQFVILKHVHSSAVFDPNCIDTIFPLCMSVYFWYDHHVEIKRRIACNDVSCHFPTGDFWNNACQHFSDTDLNGAIDGGDGTKRLFTSLEVAEIESDSSLEQHMILRPQL